MGSLQMHCPHYAGCLALFDEKQHDPHAPLSLLTRSCPSDFSLFSWMKKVLTGNRLADGKDVKPK